MALQCAHQILLCILLYITDGQIDWPVFVVPIATKMVVLSHSSSG